MAGLDHTALKPLRDGDFQRLGQQVANQLRLAIVAGEVSAGTRLVEDELASRLRVSRGPVRDALRELAEEGLVDMANRGAFVVPLNTRDVWELYSFRTVLESFALELAAERFTEEDITASETILESMARSAKEGRMDDFVAEDMAFHSLFYERSGHRRLLRSWQALARSFRAILTITSIANPRTASILEKHRGILEAVKARDGAAAKRVLQAHLEEAETVLRRVYNERNLTMDR